MEINDIIIDDKKSLRDGLQILNEKGSGFLFVVSGSMILKGVLTDGDVRRYLVSQNNLDAPITEVMNTDFTSLPSNSDNSQILEKLDNRIKCIPLLNNDGVLVDYASINRLRRISIASPLLEGNELTYLTECIKTNWISSQGKFVRKFEQLFKDYHEGFEALAVSNGTVALHLALVALGVGPGDEVLVQSNICRLSKCAVIYAGTTPILVDIDQQTLNMNADCIEELITDNTKAIMPVHLWSGL